MSFPHLSELWMLFGVGKGVLLPISMCLAKETKSLNAFSWSNQNLFLPMSLVDNLLQD